MLVSRRSRAGVIAAIAAAVVVIAVIVSANAPGTTSPPELAAPAHGTLSAPGPDGLSDAGHGVKVGQASHHDRSRPLTEVAAKPVRAVPADEEEVDQQGDQASAPHAADRVVQDAPAAPAMPAASRNFDGIAFPGVACFCAPPDTNGEAGSTQYVQIVNDGYQVFDKATGSSVYGPVGAATIWTGFGGVCETNGDGDPVVLYDQFAGRWLLSQFAGASVPTDECIAVSTSSDATGAWNRYAFHLGSNFYDYPHLAVWPDGYYLSDNVYNSAGTSFLGPQPFVFDRTAMLAGQPATFQTISGPLGSLVNPILPADIDGSSLPPAGAPESFVRWPGGGTYQTYHYHVDWATPSNSTWTTFATPAAASFTQLCPLTRSCVPQAGTTSKLDGIGDRIMFRLAYRNFGDHESVVGNYSVSAGGVSGIRWFELRNVTSGPETVYQESTYQPDTTWRWMGSAAMDGSGDLAIGFSASSGSIAPQIRYAGRLATDPLNTLGQGEATLFAGAGSQTGTSSRWGDYSDLTVDPGDDCTFWYTTEYYSSTASFNWRTRIGSFAMPGCGGAPPTKGSIAGHVTDASTHAALSGATVTISGVATTTTDAAGAYSFSGLDPMTYTLTASDAGYVTSAPASVPVTAGSTTTQDFAVAPVPATTTAFVFPTGASAVTTGAGDNNGYETNPTNLEATDGAFAVDANSGTAKSLTCTSTGRDKENTSGFAFGAPSSSAVLGIQVRLVGKVDSNRNQPEFCVLLSSDAGATWTAGKTTSSLSTTTATYTVGSTADTWGRSWTGADLGAGFRVRIVDLANSTARTFSLDSVSVSVTYR